MQVVYDDDEKTCVFRRFKIVSLMQLPWEGFLVVIQMLFRQKLEFTND
jgi:hypothetical protein